MPVFFCSINGKELRVESGQDGELVIGGRAEVIDLKDTGDNRYSVVIGGRSVSICVSGPADDRSYLVNGKRASVVIESERTRLLNTLSRTGRADRKPLDIAAPMPALVSSILVRGGDIVTAGQPLVVLEAMKMENEVRAHADGIIATIFVTKGDSVEKGALLLRIEAPANSE